MACGSCSGGSCGSAGGVPNGCGNNGNCSTGGCGKLEVFDWLVGMESTGVNTPTLAEVRFKNTRKEIYRYSSNLSPSAGDVVVVESSFGYDIGTITLTGELVKVQLQKKTPKININSLGKIVRLATQKDIDIWLDAQKQEDGMMIKARKAAAELKLDMKISDVEFQGDGSKATFYYTSEGRVDFRELIKKFAIAFKVRVEMKQIGARQEAGRVGGIGSCGRELCCSTWLTDFRSVSTSAARYQQLSINPIKLAGQCGKLKCCLNYELDTYLDALKGFPEGDVKLKTKNDIAFLQKTDIFRRILWFNTKEEPSVFHPLKLDTVHEILELNKNKEYPESIKQYAYRETPVEPEMDYENVIGDGDLNRFNKNKKNNRNSKRKKSQNNSRPDKKNVARAKKPASNTGKKPQNQQRKNRPQKQNKS